MPHLEQILLLLQPPPNSSTKKRSQEVSEKPNKIWSSGYMTSKTNTADLWLIDDLVEKKSSRPSCYGSGVALPLLWNWYFGDPYTAKHISGDLGMIGDLWGPS